MFNLKTEFPLPSYDFTSPAASESLKDSKLPSRFRAPVPENLVGLRHAPSEWNVFNDYLREHGDEHLPPELLQLRERPDNLGRVVVGGEKYVEAAVDWVKAEIKFPFDAAYVSPYVRALETAGRFGKGIKLPVQWKIDSRIGERSYGEFGSLSFDAKKEGWKRRKEDVRYWTPPNGESLEHIELEARDFLRSVSTRFHSGSVLAVSHGEFLLALRMVIEYPSNERLRDLIADGLPNCGIIHYTRRDPHSGTLAPYYKWVRLVDPKGRKSGWDGAWREIIRPSYTSEELLAEAEKHPRFLKFSTRE